MHGAIMFQPAAKTGCGAAHNGKEVQLEQLFRCHPFSGNTFAVYWVKKRMFHFSLRNHLIAAFTLSNSSIYAKPCLLYTSKSKRSQGRRGIPYLKVEWFCAKKSPAKSNWVCIIHFCFMIQVYTPWFWPFCMEICFKRWFWSRDNYSCLGVFFDDDGKSFALSPALFFLLLGFRFLLLGFHFLFWALFPSAFPLFGVYCCL